MTSDDILRRGSAPASLIVVGGGAVGVEFASFFNDIGSQVTLLEYLPAIVPLEDREVSQLIERSFTKRGHAGHHEGTLRRGQGARSTRRVFA